MLKISINKGEMKNKNKNKIRQTDTNTTTVREEMKSNDGENEEAAFIHRKFWFAFVSLSRQELLVTHVSVMVLVIKWWSLKL